MGVLNLWKILQTTSQSVNIVDDIKNKTLAVDLSIWICENSNVGYYSSNTKPYLRTLFFRCKTLIENGCKLIFIREGDVISLKQDTMKKRNAIRFGESSQKCSQQTQFSQSQSKPKSRSRFDIVADECTELLRSMGITVIRSPCGEAEKACAFLNLIGRCDAVLTNDSDVFLYGARCVYRNFSSDKKSGDVIEKYNMDTIEKTLGYDREMLVVLALLLGCDYDAKGVPGCGKEMACKLLNELNGLRSSSKGTCFSVFDILRKWSCVSTDRAYSKTEDKVRRLALAHASAEGVRFPNEDIINEYMAYTKMAQILLAEEKYLQIKWSRPNLEQFQLFNEKEQNWTLEYSAEKLVPLIIEYEHLGSDRENRSIKPIEIVKTRRKEAVEYYEVKWSKIKSKIDCDLSGLNEYTTLQRIDLFRDKFPELANDYQAKIDEKKVSRKNKKKKEKLKDDEKEDHYYGMDSLMELYEDFSLVEEKQPNERKCKEKVETKKKQVKPKKVNEEIALSQPIFTQISTLELKTSYRLRDIIELSDDEEISPSQQLNNKTIVLDTDDDDEDDYEKKIQPSKSITLNLDSVIKSLETIQIEKIEQPKLDESYLPLSQRIKQKFNLKSNSIFD